MTSKIMARMRSSRITRTVENNFPLISVLSANIHPLVALAFTCVPSVELVLNAVGGGNVVNVVNVGMPSCSFVTIPLVLLHN